MQSFKDFLLDSLGISEEAIMDLDSFMKEYNWKKSYIKTINKLDIQNRRYRYFNLMRYLNSDDIQIIRTENGTKFIQN